MSTTPSFTKVYHKKAYPAIDPSRRELSHYGRTVLITGAGSGLGRAVALAYSAAGAWKIVLVGRREDRLRQTERAIQALEQGNEVDVCPLDVVDTDTVNAVFSHLPYIDVLVNAAGYSPGPDQAAIATTPVSTFFRGLEVNVKGLYNVLQAFLQQQPQHPTATSASTNSTFQRDRVFINYATKYAHLPCIAMVPPSYSVSKLAAAKLLEAAAVECGQNSTVRFYTLHPGVVETEMSIAAIAPHKAEDIGLIWYEKELSAGFTVWLSAAREGGGNGGKVPSGRFLWANWDVEELERRAGDLAEKEGFLRTGLQGWDAVAEGEVR